MNRRLAEERTARAVDVLVIGAGPAGLAAAALLAAAGAGRVEVLEREPEAGGVPRHCARTGFGADARGRALDGPGYARRAVRAARRAGAVVRTGVSATGWAGPLRLETTAPTGLETIGARAVVLATGARERSRPARLLPGTRTQGVLTTGELQRTVALFGARPERIGRRAVVVGDDPVAGHAVRLLRRAGVAVAAVVAEGPRAAAGVRDVPVLTGTVVTELTGRGRLDGVTVRGRDGRTRTLRCDTLVLTGDWIPEHELARAAGLPLAPGGRGPLVDAAPRTGVPGVFAAGGLVHGGVPAVRAAAEGRTVARAVLAHLAHVSGGNGGASKPAEAPGRAGPTLRSDEPVRRAGPTRRSDASSAAGRARRRQTGGMPVTRSAGLLVFRRTGDGGIEVLIGHMGGPFWARREEAAWTVPKGEYGPEEAPEDAARREFREELGLPVPDGDWLALGEVRQKGGKTVTVWAVEGDLDPAAVVPGTFAMEWPPRSGVRAEFPELDRVGWFAPETAEPLLVAGQRVFLERLLTRVRGRA